MSDNLLITRSITCGMCKTVYTFRVRAKGLIDWMAGALIQDALPELSPEHRELLKTQICGPCFKKLFNKADEEMSE